jgi:hypothetical protein
MLAVRGNHARSTCRCSILLRGIVRMLDQGTRMLNVAAMMSVLKLAMIELDGEHDDDDDQD